MGNYLSAEERAAVRSKVLHAAAILFLEKGYAQSTTREIADKAGINVSAMNRHFRSKENILCELVSFVLGGQFGAAHKLIDPKTEDKLLYYAAETTLQLYMAESYEAVRELYAVAYSMPRSSELIRQAVTEQLVMNTFQEYHPDYTAKDFYELEIASGGIIRGYMMVKCDDNFTMEQKVRRFLQTALRIYEIPEERICEALEFVKQFDYPLVAQKTIESMFQYLEQNKEL